MGGTTPRPPKTTRTTICCFRRGSLKTSVCVEIVISIPTLNLCMYVELLPMIEKSLIESDFLPVVEASFSKCHRLSGGGKSNSIGEHTIVGIKYNFRRNRKALAIDGSLTNPVVLVVLVFMSFLSFSSFSSFVVLVVLVVFVILVVCVVLGGGHSPHFRPDFRSFLDPSVWLPADCYANQLWYSFCSFAR